MCRMAAYLGPDIRLEQFLILPPHSLVEQSYAPQELVYAKVNVDGYGYGWYDDNGLPASYVSTHPIWSDPNLESLGRTMKSNLWLANIRSATKGMTVSHANTQPFHDDELLFMHNGYIENFAEHSRREIAAHLSNDIQASVQGTTDSEYIFALFREVLASNKELSIEEALGESLDMIDDHVGEDTALLNILISDGELLYACRHAVNHASPSLYFTTDDAMFPGGQLIASERLTLEALWQPVPEKHILIMSNDEPPELLPL